jgi:hypothetical protein
MNIRVDQGCLLRSYCEMVPAYDLETIIDLVGKSNYLQKLLKRFLNKSD